MESFFARHKNTSILFGVLAVQFIGLASQIQRPTENGPVRLIRQWTVAAVTPFEKGIVRTQDWMHHTWSDYFYLREVRRDNRELREQIARMKLEQVRLQQDAAQARRLQALFEFKEQYITRTVAAQVIGSGGAEISHVVYLDRGSRDGIQPSMAVITPAGIVGKVLRVYPSTSQVLEISDQSSGVGAALTQSRLQGILKGQPSGDPNLAYVMSDEKVTPGEEVVTSGGDSIFPKGLPIGKVSSVEPGKDLFLNIRVKPAADLSRLEEVLVITQVEEKAPDTKGLGPIRAADILAERLPSVPEKPPVAMAPNTPAVNGLAVGGVPSAGTQSGGKPQNIPGSGTNHSAVGASPTKATVASSGASSSAKPATATAKPGTAAKPPSTASPRTTAAPGDEAGATPVSPPKRKQPQAQPAQSAAGNGLPTPAGENPQAH